MRVRARVTGCGWRPTRGGPHREAEARTRGQRRCGAAAASLGRSSPPPPPALSARYWYRGAAPRSSPSRLGLCHRHVVERRCSLALPSPAVAVVVAVAVAVAVAAPDQRRVEPPRERDGATGMALRGPLIATSCCSSAERLSQGGPPSPRHPAVEVTCAWSPAACRPMTKHCVLRRWPRERSSRRRGASWTLASCVSQPNFTPTGRLPPRQAE